MIKNPFAYSIDLKKVVEVSTVRKGRACQCQCLTCEQAVVAKKGDVKEWHFAHDSNPDRGPLRECETSFLPSCRQFIIASALSGEITTLSTPPYILYNEEITTGRVLENLEWKKGANNFDLLTHVNDRDLHIYFSYPGRKKPAPPKIMNNDGFLEISILEIERSIDHGVCDGRNILRQAIELFRDNSSQYWIHHPLINSDRANSVKERFNNEKIENERIRENKSRLQNKTNPIKTKDLTSNHDIKDCPFELPGKVTSYPKGYQGLTDSEKDAIKSNPETFRELQADFIRNGNKEESATIKAAATLMIRAQKAKSRQ
ncbi:hypothetical protein [Alcanivorax sp.]|uniref:competence protein CoiA family protein n=1 Tax=Alcanivorax sp. TaxID=1872427 RepID=UPI002B269C76|nr:hypothetical protein [Alcanivorax sp.]